MEFISRFKERTVNQGGESADPEMPQWIFKKDFDLSNALAEVEETTVNCGIKEHFYFTATAIL